MVLILVRVIPGALTILLRSLYNMCGLNHMVNRYELIFGRVSLVVIYGWGACPFLVWGRGRTTQGLITGPSSLYGSLLTDYKSK